MYVFFLNSLFAEFHQKPIKSESSVPKKSLFDQSNSIDLNNNDANYHDAESKSPINMYSTSPSSSFSCSSSDSSIFSLSNISYSNKEDKGEFDLSQIDANSNQNFESDKYKPEDIKRFVFKIKVFIKKKTIYHFFDQN